MPLKHFLYILTLAVAIILCAGCRRGTSDNPELLHAAYILDNEPDSIEEAVRILKDISQNNLNQGDKSLQTLLSVKADDKLYIPHTSDSLILSSLKYEEKHRKRGYYPEALYYAGRVYSDLGDYPEALKFFNMAAENADHLSPLYSRILSQTGRLYNNVNLYTDAAQTLKKTISTNEALSDTESLSFNCQLLGSVYMHQDELDSADIYIDKAFRLSKQLSKEHQAFMKLYKAVLMQKSGRTDSALMLIEDGGLNVWDDSKPFAYISAATIYYEVGRYSEAFVLARKILDLPPGTADRYRASALTLLLKPEMRSLLNRDSIDSLIESLLTEVALEQKRTESEDVSIIKNRFNYTKNLQAKEEAVLKQKNLEIFMAWLSISILLLMLGWAASYIHKKRKYASLLEKYTALSHLKLHPDSPRVEDMEEEYDLNQDKLSLTEQIAHRLNDIITAISDSADDSERVDKRLLDSQAYVNIQRYLAEKKPIPDSDLLWKEMEQTLLRLSPSFKLNLRMLIGHLSIDDYRLLILIKYGVRPGETAGLLGKSKQAVSGQRTKLRKRLAGDRVNTELLDPIIQSL